MSDEQTVDMMAGLNAVVAILEAIRVDVRAIGPVDRVRLASLQWAMNKLADDLHKADVEIRNARKDVASARREADTAQQQQQAEQLQSLSIFNGLGAELRTVKAERDAANEQHAIAVRRYDAEVERRLALETQAAGLTARAKKPWLEWQPTAHVDKLYKRIPGDGIMVHKLLVGHDLPALYEAGFRYLPITPEAELSGNSGELPAEPAPEPAPSPEWTLWELDQTIEATDGSRITLTEDNLGEWPKWYRQGFRRKKPPEPAPEPYQWQVGDEIVRDGAVRQVKYINEVNGLLLVDGQGWSKQLHHEADGWKLHRKASELPDIPPFTEQQMADFKAVMAQVSDSVGTDGEGQS
jgi:hypothetical protein